MINISKTGHVRKFYADCDKCNCSFSFEKEDANVYETDYTNLNIGYVSIACPTCKTTITKDFSEMK